MTEKQSTTGVQELIDRLSQEGVAEGQRLAGEMLDDAKRKADAVVDEAKNNAKEIIKEAREEADRYRAAGEEALRLAARDATRDFGAKIHEGLRQRLQELVREQVDETKLIRRMILEITRAATADIGDGKVEVLLPETVITEEKARKKIEAGEKDVLTEFVEELIGESVREGFTIQLSDQQQPGPTVKLIDEHVEIDLSADAISDLIAQHLLPRFRAIMRKNT